jgi:hypothetical protein
MEGGSESLLPRGHLRTGRSAQCLGVVRPTAAKLGGSVSIALDYAPSASSVPRYGHGRPPHPRPLELLRRRATTFGGCLRSFLRYAEELSKIEPRSVDLLETSWIHDFLPGLDGVAIYGFLRERRPARYFEIGSGNSTKFAERARRDGELATRIRSIDPDPRAEVDALCDEIVRAPLESVDISSFDELTAGDVLLMPLWAGPRFEHVERHGGAFWLQTWARPRRLIRR